MKIIKGISLIFLIMIILLAVVVFAFLSYTNYINRNYWKFATPAGEIEKKYTALGLYDVSYVEFDADHEAHGKYEIWYPTEMNENRKTYPLVVMANGTGVKASQYKEVFKHLSSWGFIVIGNEDENSRTGASSAATLDFILKLNDDKNSEFFDKIDIKNIGIAGHSQGGVGTINAATAQPNSNLYKAMFTASTTSSYWGQDNIFGSEWRYDVSKVDIPYFMVGGTGAADAGTAENIAATKGQGICPLWSMTENYNAIPNSINKIMARKVGKDHGDMLRYADGYMTAWFMYWLKDDDEAGRAFFGDHAEILTNANWQDVKITPQN
ncbi:poly(ethylene terephthalate) hydrolase family protein [Paenibacillus dakarensis]|uniref:poly(ethylene terephthalate) hydrolase family protein n=1 Tax=Paenibacillus dakarensis TaxID=1527293 RepID=UPI0006D5416E|nr:hypothetical protein [Paenibacillus dakarensis]